MQRLKFSFVRKENLKFISHLDIMRAFQRAIRRAGIPVSYSRGFNPQPRLSIALPLPLGVTSESEIAEVYLDQKISPASFADDLNRYLPEGISVFNAAAISPDAPPLMQGVDAALYRVILKGGIKIPEGFLAQVVEEVKSRDEIIVQRTGKKGTRKINIRPYVYNIVVLKDKSGNESLEMFLQTGSRGGARPVEVVRLLARSGGFDADVHDLRIHRVGLFQKKGDEWETL